MKKQILFGVLILSLLVVVLVYGVDDAISFIIAFLTRLIIFVKKNIIKIVMTFFFVKGKFILTLFLKKIALLSVTGLGKRYMIERVFMENFKIHFLDHLADDIKRLTSHAKENFKNFPLVKKLITIFAFIGSLGFVGKFMGGMIAIKVFVAKVWSFLLAIFLKFGSGVLYFFTDYLWGSWLAPIVEVIIFSWFLSWMEKIPFLAKILSKIYAFFISIFGWLEHYADKVFHIPIKRLLIWSVKKIQRYIYRFIGYDRVSAQKRLIQSRSLNPNRHIKLMTIRKESKKGNSYISIRDRILQKRREK